MKGSASAFPPRPPGGKRGFTLIELIIGIGMMLLLAVGAYRIVLSVAGAGAEIQRQQARREAVAALIDTLRAVFRSMPGDAAIELMYRSAAEEGPVDLIFRDDPAHNFSALPPPEGAPVILRLEPQGQGLFDLVRYTGLPAPPGIFDPPIEPDSRLVLLRDIRSMTWEAFDSQTGQWVAKFPRDGTRPRLLRLDLLPAEEAVPTRIVFALAPKGVRGSGQTTTHTPEGGLPPPGPENGTRPPGARRPIEVPVPIPAQ